MPHFVASQMGLQRVLMLHHYLVAYSFWAISFCCTRPAAVPFLLGWRMKWTGSDCLSASYNWAATWEFQQCGMCDQQILRSVWLEPLLVTWIFYDCWTTGRKAFGDSKLKRRLHRLVWVYTCQNATLLEITYRGSIMPSFN